MEDRTAAQRFKQIREELGLTQAAFAEGLGLSTTADIERGKIKLSGKIVSILLKDYQINPLWLFGESHQKHLEPKKQDILPKVISIDNTEQENILLVSAKVAAGYADNINDQKFYQELPAFSFPLAQYRNASFRGFQVTGDSMLPAIQPEDWIIATALGSVQEIKDGNIYIIVEAESLLIKQVHKLDNNTIQLISLNKDYPPIEVATENILEIWEFHSKLSSTLNTKTDDFGNIKQELEDIKNAIREIKAGK